MAIAISPHHMADEFKNGMTLDDKVKIFIDRVQGWQLGVAREMIDKGVMYRAFALLLIVISYFEMIAKYREGFAGPRSSPEYFKKGVRYTFPEIDQDDPASVVLLDCFNDAVRNQLYHLARLKSNIFLRDDVPAAFGFGRVNGQPTMVINPDVLVEDLQIKFAQYADELRNPANAELRSNFERRFDLDDGPWRPSGAGPEPSERG